MMKEKLKIEELEISLFLEGVFQKSGYDFRDYAPTSLQRRILKTVTDLQVSSISALQGAVLHDDGAMKAFIQNMSINVSAMFRNPIFFLEFKKKVIPVLRDLSFIRLWIAGCSSGEEVYSIAILLTEEGLYEKSKIYATDIDESMLEQAKMGIYPLKVMQDYTANYLAAGGTAEFSNYYNAKYDHAVMRKSLQKNVVWAQHNLVTDASPNEFHVILCRNVMIYFNRDLQSHVHKLFYKSLGIGGILGLGSGESIRFTPYEDRYELLDAQEKLLIVKK